MIYFMAKCVFWVFIIYGITQIIVDSELFEKVRNTIQQQNPRLGQLVNCMLCTSVWVAFMISVMFWSPSEVVFLHDVLDVENYKAAREYQPTGSFEMVVHSLGMSVMKIITRLKFVFLDGMFGSAVVWFLYMIERLLHALIGFLNSYKKGVKDAVVEEQSVQSD